MNWLQKLAFPDWFAFDRTVTLYHGTTSALQGEILSKGLVPPPDNIQPYVERLVRKMVDDSLFSEELVAAAVKNALSLRADTERHELLSVTFLTPGFEGAKRYSISYSKLGGEIAYDVFSSILIYYSKNIGELPSDARENPPPGITWPYPEGEPIVVEVEVPWEWMMTYRDLRALYEQYKSIYRSEKYQHIDWGKGFEEWLRENAGDFEVRVSQTIPPNMITAIHTINS